MLTTKKIKLNTNNKNVIKSACKFSLEHKLQIFHQQASSKINSAVLNNQQKYQTNWTFDLCKQFLKKHNIIMLLVKLCIFCSTLTLMLISAELTSVDEEKNPENNARVGKFFGLFGLLSGK